MNKILLTIALLTVCNLAQADYNDQQQQMLFAQQQIAQEAQRQNFLIRQQMAEQQRQQMNSDFNSHNGLDTRIPLMGQPPRLCGPYGCY